MNKEKEIIYQQIVKELENHEYPLTINEIVEKTLELAEAQQIPTN